MTNPDDATNDRIDETVTAADETGYELTLFVSGASDLSARAVANATTLCDIHLAGRYKLAVLDLHSDSAAVRNSQVIAAPTLVKNRPLPERKFVGDLSQTDKVLEALALPFADESSRAHG